MPSPVLALLALFTLTTSSFALTSESQTTKDNQLSEEEQKAGWQLLFNGHDHTGWKCNNGKPVQTPIENSSLLPYKSGGYIVIHEKQFGDFVFKCDVRWEAADCNSGIFFRIENPKNPVHTGFEVQIMSGTKTGKHQLGAIYDIAPSTKNVGKPTGEWNSVEITCHESKIDVVINSTKVCSIDCNDFDRPGFCPDGSKHKYHLDNKPRAVKDFARKGYLGFQDHGQKVWYKNVKVLELN